MRHWKTVPFGSEKIMATTNSWHPGPDINKTRARRKIKEDIKERLNEYFKNGDERVRF